MIGVAKFAPGYFFAAEYLQSVLDRELAPCWAELERGLEVGYQIEYASQTSSLFVVEGDLPAPVVEKCVPLAFGGIAAAFGGSVKVARDGDIVSFEVPKAGTAHAAWRGRFIVVGGRDQVRAARAVAQPSASWGARIAAFPSAQAVIARTDRAFEMIFGVPTTGYEIAFTDLAALQGHVTVHYESGADAALAAQRHASRNYFFPIPPPPSLDRILRKVEAGVTGPTLRLDFDNATFDRLDLGELLGWLAEAQAELRVTTPS